MSTFGGFPLDDFRDDPYDDTCAVRKRIVKRAPDDVLTILVPTAHVSSRSFRTIVTKPSSGDQG